MIRVAILIAAVAAVAMADLILHKPMPYSFGYSVKDKHGEQHREETGDGLHNVKGSYGFIDERGIKRQVNYVADKLGFRAEVKTNEPGTANQDPAAVKMISTEPYLAGGLGLGLGVPIAPIAPIAPIGLKKLPLIEPGLGLGLGGLGMFY